MPASALRILLAAFYLLAGIAGASAAGTVTIGLLTQARAPVEPVSPLDPEVTDEGPAGARLGLADDRSTGRFTDQDFALAEVTLGPDGPAPAMAAFAKAGVTFVVADLDAAALRAVLADPASNPFVVLNARAPDDDLRTLCRPNLLHTIPSRAMLADALAQYLVVRRWTRWFLLAGEGEGNRLYAEAVRRAAKRFGAEIVEDRVFDFRIGQGRTDTGYVQLQTELPVATRTEDHDVLVVADEAHVFDEYLDGRTDLPRAIAGTAGLRATAFDPVVDQFGAAQLQERFRRLAGRRMGAVDYAAWAAVRAVGEAAVRTRSADPQTLAAYLRSPDFTLAGFKGQGQSFRPWDGQMRQPVVIAGPRLTVSVSPQPGFLHEFTELDTLGVDRPESPCGS